MLVSQVEGTTHIAVCQCLSQDTVNIVVAQEKIKYRV
jgi:hypothetical protein